MTNDEQTPGESPDQTTAQTPDHEREGLDLALEAARAAARFGDPARRRTPRKLAPQDVGERKGRPKVSGAYPDDRDPQMLSDLMGRMINTRGWEVDLAVQGVFGRWAEVVGADIAAHCSPENLVDGHLLVRTDSTAWATQLRLLAPDLVRRLNVELGHGTVTVIDVEGPRGPSWRKGQRRAPGGRGPRDTYG